MTTTTAKERIDVLLVERGFYESREKAKAALMAGLVLVNDEPVDKSGMKVARSADIKVKGALHPYVSRGGLKLEKAIRVFNIDLRERVMLDIGASTVALPTAHYKMGHHMYMLLMLDITNLIGR